jgi:hypothetical protein
MLVYGPNKTSSLSSIEAWLKPTASLAVRGEKLGRDPQIGQSACWRCSREFLFLGSSGIHPNLSLTCERLLYTDYVRYIWPGTIRGPSMENVWCVGRVFPYRVYINLNRHNSWICVPLVCGSHHVLT